MSAARDIYGLSFAALARELVASGLKAVHARALWKSLYRDPNTALLPPLQRWVEANLGPGKRFSRQLPAVDTEIASSDRLTRKLLIRLQDGQQIETVLMGYPGRLTACVSTQVGCAMGCVFCATGQMGYVRHLSPGEIVAQILRLGSISSIESIPSIESIEMDDMDSMDEMDTMDPPMRVPRNLVLMGMGEPLHNYENVMAALEIISDPRGLNLAPSRISISTVGLVPGILRLAQEKQPYNLAVSLHGATDEERSELVPVGKRWPLNELMEACRTYFQTTGRRIFFEWTLVAGKNDAPEHAHRLAKLLSGLDAHVNLIPLNPTAGFSGAPPHPQGAEEFQRILMRAQIPSTVRQRRGIDVAAGCGQLRGLGRQD
jgi:23S rRNA (adenine2503-C2)-methyltransferase